jgi:hypothetical protein
MITTTLKRIREHSPCQERWTKLLAGLGKTAADDEALPFATILEINDLCDALWCCRAEPQYDREWRLLAVAYARHVEHLNTDPRVKNANDVAERYANGEATDEELTAARDAAEAAGDTAEAAGDAWAAWAAARAAAESAWSAAWAAAGTAAGAAAWAAGTAGTAAGAAWAAGAAGTAAGTAAGAAAGAAAWSAARAAAEAAERKWQTEEFLRVVTETEAREP